MARPRKLPTQVVRINADLIMKAKKKAKRKRMSLPDYLAWRLSK
tara:strand:+ start:6321 stop:6452 length:132 start_codon:yes stop_codon:yes gene_type:complete